MESFKRTSDLVRHILKTVPETRDSDNLLYYRVCEHFSNKIGVDLLCSPFGSVILNLKEYGLPPFETVRRTRQKLQHDNPELAGNDDVEAYRVLNEEKYRNYSLQHTY